MQYIPDTTDSFDFAPFSEVIDVRAPDEFALDHIPGAINLPVLDDDQRRDVGTLHKRESPFAARRFGAALVAQNIGAIIAGPLASRGATYRPLIYCWRGGMRSRSLAIVLAQIGWPAVVLAGGYRRYRGWVREQLQVRCETLELVRLAGPTGCGKTALLGELTRQGEQVIDLEGLAAHRGSVLGADPQCPQPSQKMFESQLVAHLRGIDPRRPVWIESESSKIGRVHCPATLWQRMKVASVVHIDAPLAERAQLLLDQYPHYVADPRALKQQLDTLRQYVGAAELDRWYRLIDAENWQPFVEAILVAHYDRTYSSVRLRESDASASLTLPSLSALALAECARELARRYGQGVT